MQLNLQNLPTEFQTAFHKSQMARVRKEVANLSYISHVRHGEKYFIKTRLKNEVKGKDEVMFPLHTSPNKITDAEYTFIIETLNSGEYGRDKKTL